MKIITVGDIHGSTLWKNIKPDEWDKIIFMGDYTDHWTYTDAHILNNLKDIIQLKEIYPDKVELLLGNHDMQYMFLHASLHSCSGYRPSMNLVTNQLFIEKKILFKAAHFELSEDGEKYLWTHAGVSEPWYVERFLPLIEMMGSQDDDIGEQLNYAFRTYQKEMFDVGFERGGSNMYGGPFWADRTETQKNPLPRIHQIIGHTKLDKITCFWDLSQEQKSSVTYVDVLEGDSPEFHEQTI